jgi:hypothetical protein
MFRSAVAERPRGILSEWNHRLETEARAAVRSQATWLHLGARIQVRRKFGFWPRLTLNETVSTVRELRFAVTNAPTRHSLTLVVSSHYGVEYDLQDDITCRFLQDHAELDALKH